MESFSNLDIYDTIIKRVDKLLREEHIRASIDSNQSETLLQFCAIAIQSIRFPTIIATPDVIELWDMVRQYQQISDLVMDVTVEVELVCQLSGFDYAEKLAPIIAKAFGAMVPEIDSREKKKLKSGDDLFTGIAIEDRERFCNAEEMTLCLKTNPWLASLFLIRQTPYVSETLQGIALLRSRIGGRTEQQRE